jgi:hypothetical protein
MKTSSFLTLLTSLMLSACFLAPLAKNPKTVLVAKDILCVIEHAYVDDAALNKLCDLLTPERIALAREIAQSHRAAMVKKPAACRSSDSLSDAGVEAGSDSGAGADVKEAGGK